MCNADLVMKFTHCECHLSSQAPPLIKPTDNGLRNSSLVGQQEVRCGQLGRYVDWQRESGKKPLALCFLRDFPREVMGTERGVANRPFFDPEDKVANELRAFTADWRDDGDVIGIPPPCQVSGHKAGTYVRVLRSEDPFGPMSTS